jgi:hypothetical protein
VFDCDRCGKSVASFTATVSDALAEGAASVVTLQRGPSGPTITVRVPRAVLAKPPERGAQWTLAVERLASGALRVLGMGPSTASARKFKSTVVERALSLGAIPAVVALLLLQSVPNSPLSAGPLLVALPVAVLSLSAGLIWATLRRRIAIDPESAYALSREWPIRQSLFRIDTRLLELSQQARVVASRAHAVDALRQSLPQDDPLGALASRARAAEAAMDEPRERLVALYQQARTQLEQDLTRATLERMVSAGDLVSTLGWLDEARALEEALTRRQDTAQARASLAG